MDNEFGQVEAAIAAVARGEFVVVVDDLDRENEGDLICAAETMTVEKMSFLLKHTSGIVCAPMSGEYSDRLMLPPMVAHNTESHRTAFTISVDLADGTSTGISASDRAMTIKALADPASCPDDFRRPGHIFPLRARPGGVLKRAGHTEATTDLMEMAGMAPVGVLCEVVNHDYSMARRGDLITFAKEHNLVMISVADLVRYRRSREKLVKFISEARLPTQHGVFRSLVYESMLDGEQHLCLVKGEVKGAENVLVRVHSECLTGDIFGSIRCDCGSQLQSAMAKVADEEYGVIVYLRGQEGRGIGLGHKIRAYGLQDLEGLDTVEANLELGLPVDSREYGIGAQILADLGVTTIRLLTNNPKKYGGIKGFGLEIVERVPLPPRLTEENRDYLMTKKLKMGHELDLEEKEYART